MLRSVAVGKGAALLPCTPSDRKPPSFIPSRRMGETENAASALLGEDGDAGTQKAQQRLNSGMPPSSKEEVCKVLAGVGLPISCARRFRRETLRWPVLLLAAEDVKEGCCCCAPSYIDTVTAHRRKTIAGLPRRATAQVERRMQARSCHPSSCTAGRRTGRVYRWAPPLLPNGGGKGAALLPCTPSEGKPPSFIQPENGRNRERRPCCYSLVPPEGKPDAKLCRDPSLVARRRRETRHRRPNSIAEPPWPPSTITASNATTQTPEKEGLLPLLPLTAATARSRRTESEERERGDSACGRWPNGEERTVEAVRYPSPPRTGEAVA
nr:hypothetical protein Iba_chr09cCG11330 [Ipomoea batatas]